jgi:class 3 adenylate cyclase
MTCAACGHANRETAKFCEECGRTLGAAAASARDPRAYTPHHIAERILTARSALEGERKQVTVLFADVQNSMQLAERLGAEEWHRVLDRFFHLLNEGVHRFEGTVNQYTGDGIMALFGAPLAHEDHAQRACHAALHLLDRLRGFGEEISRRRGVPFAVRMGLNSGEVVVARIGDDLRMDYTAQGHTVGLAQRVEQLAAPNTACVAQATAALIADYFDLRDLGEFVLKGVSEPVRVHALERPRPERTRIDVVLSRSGARFVGRHAELGVLERGLDEALAGHGRVIGVVGEPGVGKTRLCLELTRQCRARGAVLAQAHCPAHAASVALLPILDLLHSLFGVDSGEAPEVSRRKVRRTLLQLSRGFADTLPFAFDLLQVADPAQPVQMLEEQRRARLADFLRRLVQAQSAAAPLVLFIDDLHWIDPDGDALLGEIVDALGWTHTLLLVNFRPGYRAAWMTASYFEEQRLAALSDADVDELLIRLMGSDRSTDDLRRLIRDRTGGNPFFVEEVVQSLIDHGSLTGGDDADADASGGRAAPRLRLTQPIAELAIPPTVQALLSARLDRLPERDKLVLQAAAVIGPSFSLAVLRHVLAGESSGAGATSRLPAEVVDASLAALAEADFIRRAGESETEYAFKHPLTQAVAYGTQLAEARTRLHVGVAQALQTLHADRLGQYAGLLAHHFGAANWKFEARRWRRRAMLRVTNIELGRQQRR